MSFAALGTKIFALMNRRCGFVYDTETGVLGVGAHAPLHMVCGSGTSVAVGGVLYALTYRYFDEQHPIDFEAMSWAPGAAVAGTMQQQPAEGWLWKSLLPPPFRRGVQSYALHPDGCTIFTTTRINVVHAPVCGNPLGTYSFNTKESAWRWHGEWVLPFLGRAHFDAELDAWTTKEKLFRKDQERHMTASLTYMGTSKFCLVECVSSRKLHDERPPDQGDDHGYELSVTMLGLKYNHKGELQTTHHQLRHSFSVSRHRYSFAPFAFWM
ncbi:hypothetical protein BS78_04G072800 [Paspalum vaginatum]|nr:hypothetical protein BS78_04G072800 [Paspalum vaginatum]